MSSIRARVHRSLQIAGFLLSISRIFVLFFSPPPIFLSVSLSLSFFGSEKIAAWKQINVNALSVISGENDRVQRVE